MAYLIDKIDSISRQSVSAAIILDSRGKVAGKVLVRFTPSQIGWNHEVSAVLYCGNDIEKLFGSEPIDLSVTLKGGTYDTPYTLYKLFKNAGLRCFAYGGKALGYEKGETDPSSLSRFNDIVTVKVGRKKYRIEWAL